MADTTSHKRRPLPDWVKHLAEAAKWDLEEAQKHYDRMLEKLQQGDGQTAGIILAKMGRRQSDALLALTQILHGKRGTE